MDWSSRVCVARNFAVTHGAQTERLGGVGTARSNVHTQLCVLPIPDGSRWAWPVYDGGQFDGISTSAPGAFRVGLSLLSPPQARGLGPRPTSSLSACRRGLGFLAKRLDQCLETSAGVQRTEVRVVF
jgi:hypothetical protein